MPRVASVCSASVHARASLCSRPAEGVPRTRGSRSGGLRHEEGASPALKLPTERLVSNHMRKLVQQRKLLIATVTSGVLGAVLLAIPSIGSADPKPPVGAHLSTVTCYALTHALTTASAPPTAANFSDLPQIADSLPFEYVG